MKPPTNPAPEVDALASPPALVRERKASSRGAHRLRAADAVPVAPWLEAIRQVSVPTDVRLIATTRPGEPPTMSLTVEGPSVLPLSLVHAEDPDPRLEAGEHAHRFFELVYIDAGEGSHVVDGEVRVMRGGNAHLLLPGQKHDIAGLMHTPRWLLSFDAEALSPELSGTEAFAPLSDGGSPLVSVMRRGAEVAIPDEMRICWLDRLRRLERALREKPPGYREESRALLVLLLLDVARASGQALEDQQTPALIRKVFGFIERRYHHPIGLRDVASALGRSGAYLTSLVRRETGRSVLAWIIERRLGEARKLLVSTDRSVQEIALDVGYSDAGHFIRQFRQRHGCTPQKWREVQREAPGSLGPSSERRSSAPPGPPSRPIVESGETS